MSTRAAFPCCLGTTRGFQGKHGLRRGTMNSGGSGCNMLGIICPRLGMPPSCSLVLSSLVGTCCATAAKAAWTYLLGVRRPHGFRVSAHGPLAKPAWALCATAPCRASMSACCPHGLGTGKHGLGNAARARLRGTRDEV